MQQMVGSYLAHWLSRNPDREGSWALGQSLDLERRDLERCQDLDKAGTLIEAGVVHIWILNVRVLSEVW